MKSSPLVPFLLVSFLLAFAWSAIAPLDRFTWFLEVVWTIAGIVTLVATHRRFRFTPLLYVLMWLHAMVQLVGGHYTYAEVPLFDWLRDVLGLARNHYDRLGHFMQGFVPAMIAREMLARRSPLDGSRWLPFLCGCFALAFSAFFEMIEWWAALAFGSGADAFLATQGDVWDTQWDMFMAMIGAACSLTLLGRHHDRQLQSRHPTPPL
jgi:putative membrane protein